MKRLSAIAMMMLFVLTSFAGNAGLFSFEQDKISNELEDLNNLELFVTNNPGITYLDLQNTNNNLINNISGNALDFGFMGMEPALGIPSFLWGCVLGWVGILVVYLVTEDNEETKKALYGCITSGVLIGLFYVIFYVILASTYVVY